MLPISSVLALLTATALASLVAVEEVDVRSSTLEARTAEVYRRWDAQNPLMKVAQRAVKPDTVNSLTPQQLTDQRNALLLAQSETAREAILFPVRHFPSLYDYVSATVGPHSATRVASHETSKSNPFCPSHEKLSLTS